MSIETVVWVAVIVGVMVVGVPAVGLFLLRRRRDRLRERFGPAYERTVAAEVTRRAAERELRACLTRSGPLDIQPLDPDARRDYADRWAAVQQRFVNEPSPAVSEADLLVRAVMAKRGYSTEDFAQQASGLSLRHSHILEFYRLAHEISGRAAGRWVPIQELRQAMTHYYALFDDLIDGDEQTPRAAAHPRVALPHGAAAPASSPVHDGTAIRRSAGRRKRQNTMDGSTHGGATEASRRCKTDDIAPSGEQKPPSR